MARSVVPLRASESERKTWEQAAEASGLKLSAWLRRAANERAELEGVLENSEPEPVLKTPPSVEEVKAKMYPQKRKRCIHRLNPNTYCKTCGVTK